MEQPTHHASFYGIPCYFNENTDEIEAKNGFGLLLDIAIWIESNFPSNDYGFPVKLKNRIK